MVIKGAVWDCLLGLFPLRLVQMQNLCPHAHPCWSMPLCHGPGQRRGASQPPAEHTLLDAASALPTLGLLPLSVQVHGARPAMYPTEEKVGGVFVELLDTLL